MHIPKNWRMKYQRYALQAIQDENGRVEFPPRPAVQQRVVERYTFSSENKAEEMPSALAS